jgi:nuclear migration protein JNM1
VDPERSRPHYAYPPSPDSPTSPATHRPVPLSHRLRALQSELAALETELADPSNPLLAKEREEDNVDPGELIRGLVDVRGRLEKISKGKEGRGRLVNVVLGNGEIEVQEDGKKWSDGVQKEEEGGKSGDGKKDQEKGKAPDVRSVVEMDRRVGELEKLVGSSSTTLDEVC